MSIRTVIAGLTIAVATLVASPTYAASPHSHGPRTAGFVQVNQVSDQDGVANVTDPNLVNAWGLALGPTTPLWSANNGTSTATLYSGGVGGVSVKKVDLTVTIDGDAPTGQVFNDTSAFVVKVHHHPAPANFIFASETGNITAWSGRVSGTEARVVANVPGAVFKSLALVHTRFGPFLLAADFVNGQIDVFDSHFHLVNLPRAFFHDPRLPKGYGPFNIMVNDHNIFVTYAKQSGGNDEVHGPGLGFVDEFSNFGLSVRRIASHGTLNAPWGLAIAPPRFGRIGGALLVGNFGDGRINVFMNGHFAGQLRDAKNKKITIDGLWALLPGTETTGGTNTVWFSSGPNDENDGLVGQLIPSS